MPRGLRQCWKVMVATQNIDTLGAIWKFLLRGVLTFVASGLDINGCVLSYFERTANLHCYTSCTLTILHCIKVSFLQRCPIDIIKYLQKCESCTYFCEILYITVKHIEIRQSVIYSAHCRFFFFFFFFFFVKMCLFRKQNLCSSMLSETLLYYLSFLSLDFLFFLSLSLTHTHTPQSILAWLFLTPSVMI